MPGYDRRSSSGIWLVLLAALPLALAGCLGEPPPIHNLRAELNPSDLQRVAQETRLSWRIGPDCVDGREPDTIRRNQIADRADCRQRYGYGRDFVALALSGGGVKAATFAGEAMFMLEQLKLLRHVDMISAVSGGTMAASLYAISCDPAGKGGLAVCPPGTTRPAWQYETVMRRLTAGFHEMVGGAGSDLTAGLRVLRRNTPPDEFASFIDRSLLAGCVPSDGAACPANMLAEARPRWTFADVHPARPHLVLNATLVGERRDQADIVRRRELNLRYLQRRNADEFFHFAFTPQHFRQIGSDLAPLPLAFGVATSSAIPALFDYSRLWRFGPAEDRSVLLLSDGGNNDNQALMEVYFALQQALAGQRRSDVSYQADEFERFGGLDRALVFVINSSLTEFAGIDALDCQTNQGDSCNTALARDRGIVPLAFMNRTSSAVDVYSGDSYNLRIRLYQHALALTLTELKVRYGDSNRSRPRRAQTPPPTMASIRTPEIGLTMLDAFPLGGREALRRELAGIDDSAVDDLALEIDPDRAEFKARRQNHLRAFARLQDPERRRRLGLSNNHPQCLFEASRRADASMLDLARLRDGAGDCLRDAARWATALRVQELCDAYREPQEGQQGRANPEVSARASALANPTDMDAVCEALDRGEFTQSEDQLPKCVFYPQHDNSTVARETGRALEAWRGVLAVAEGVGAGRMTGGIRQTGLSLSRTREAISRLGPTTDCQVQNAPAVSLSAR